MLARLQQKSWFIYAVVGLIAACTIWIGAFLYVEYAPAKLPEPEILPEFAESENLAAELLKEERFRNVGAWPDPNNPDAIVVGGVVASGADLAALKRRVAEIGPSKPVIYEVNVPPVP